jgi:hypothetical protein
MIKARGRCVPIHGSAAAVVGRFMRFIRAAATAAGIVP